MKRKSGKKLSRTGRRLADMGGGNLSTPDARKEVDQCYSCTKCANCQSKAHVTKKGKPS